MIRNMFNELSRKVVLVVTLGVFGYCMSGLAQSGTVVKWEQAPDPTGWDVNFTSYTPTVTLYVADDFECKQTGPITDIHLWTSIKNGAEPGQFSFRLSLWSDVPAGTDLTYSHPGQLLWQSPGILPNSTEPIQTGLEGWYDPVTGEILPENHTGMWRYDFLIPESFAFKQTEGTIYWLGASAIYTGGNELPIGWKTSTDHWNDDAVYWSPTGVWQELRDPRTGVSLDLAFALTTPAPTVPDGGANALLLGLGLIGLWVTKRWMQ